MAITARRAPLFVTVYTHERRSIFGRIEASQLTVTPLGQIVIECWMQIPGHFAVATVHDSVLMPNHFHGILGITHPPNLVGAQPRCALPGQRVVAISPQSLSAIVRSLKAIVARRAH